MGIDVRDLSPAYQVPGPRSRSSVRSALLSSQGRLSPSSVTTSPPSESHPWGPSSALTAKRRPAAATSWLHWNRAG